MAQADATNLEIRELAEADTVSLLALRTLATGLLKTIDDLTEKGKKRVKRVKEESESTVATAIDSASADEPYHDGSTVTAVDDDTDMIL